MLFRSLTKVINDYYPEGRYIRIPLENQKFPTIINGTKFGPKLISTEGFRSLEDFIRGNNYDLDHLVLDGKANRPDFLKDVYSNEQKYPYLIKEFDSEELGFRYHVKIFKIDYNKFRSA